MNRQDTGIYIACKCNPRRITVLLVKFDLTSFNQLNSVSIHPKKEEKIQQRSTFLHNDNFNEMLEEKRKVN